VLSKEVINGMCLHFREVFVLWDGAFSLTQTVNPMEQDIKTYQRYVNAAAQGNALLRCTVTPTLHYMLQHVLSSQLELAASALSLSMLL
jgi:hypothetical protein